MMPDGAPSIVTLIGSSKFMDYFTTMMWEIEKRGIIALGLHWVIPVVDSPMFGKPLVEHHLAEHEGVADILDDLHRRKLELADEVLVLAIGGYMGDSTKSEFKYVNELGKSYWIVSDWRQCKEWLDLMDFRITNEIIEGGG